MEDESYCELSLEPSADMQIPYAATPFGLGKKSGFLAELANSSRINCLRQYRASFSRCFAFALIGVSYRDFFHSLQSMRAQ